MSTKERTIGQELGEFRRARGVSAYRLSAESGVSESAIGEIERGKRDPYASTLAKLAGALGARITITEA